MGLFQSKKGQKKPSSDPALDAVELVFDDKFREDLQNRGRLYFERVINENAALFKQDLDATIAYVNTELKQHMARQLDDQFTEISRVNTELREHVAKQLDEQFVEYSKTMSDAKELALQALGRSAQALEDQHKQLAASLEKSIASQDAMLTAALDQKSAQVTEMKEAQDAAMQALNRSAEALREQHEQLSVMLEKTIADQKAMLVDTFEQNMAQIIEHYLLGALGEQYDLKAQLPAIIKQMEENKQVIADDMKL